MLRILIAEDDTAGRLFLNKFFSLYAKCDMVVDGLEAIDAYMMSVNDKKAYDLICLDIMLPKVDGVKVLKAIRDLERQRGVIREKQSKVIITTALSEAEFVKAAFEYGCEAYVSKPIDTNRLAEIMEKLGLISSDKI